MQRTPIGAPFSWHTEKKRRPLAALFDFLHVNTAGITDVAHFKIGSALTNYKASLLGAMLIAYSCEIADAYSDFSLVQRVS